MPNIRPFYFDKKQKKFFIARDVIVSYKSYYYSLRYLQEMINTLENHSKMLSNSVKKTMRVSLAAVFISIAGLLAVYSAEKIVSNDSETLLGKMSSNGVCFLLLACAVIFLKYMVHYLSTFLSGKCTFQELGISIPDSLFKIAAEHKIAAWPNTTTGYFFNQIDACLTQYRSLFSFGTEYLNSRSYLSLLPSDLVNYLIIGYLVRPEIKLSLPSYPKYRR